MRNQEIGQLWNDIERIPFHPKKIREPLGTVVFSLPDIPAYIYQNMVKVIAVIPQIQPFFYPYSSKKFTSRIFKIKNGLELKAEVAKRVGNKRTIILVHGIFQSKNFRFIRNIASHLYSRYNFDVIVVDTRDHLGTGFLSPDFPASSGFLEGEDILEVASQVKEESETSSVFLLGFSYGGTVVLNTLNSKKIKDIVDGVIAVSPALILEHAVTHIDTKSSFFDPFYQMYVVFQLCLRLRYGFGIKTFREYLKKSAQTYGYREKVMMKRSSVTEFIKNIEIPTLILVSEDDPVIPKGDIEEVSLQSRDNGNVKVLVKEKGGHIAFSFIEPEWFYKVIGRFCGDLSGIRYE